jgi:hypothetical protein
VTCCHGRDGLFYGNGRAIHVNCLANEATRRNTRTSDGTILDYFHTRKYYTYLIVIVQERRVDHVCSLGFVKFSTISLARNDVKEFQGILDTFLGQLDQW